MPVTKVFELTVTVAAEPAHRVAALAVRLEDAGNKFVVNAAVLVLTVLVQVGVEVYAIAVI